MSTISDRRKKERRRQQNNSKSSSKQAVTSRKDTAAIRARKYQERRAARNDEPMELCKIEDNFKFYKEGEDVIGGTHKSTNKRNNNIHIYSTNAHSNSMHNHRDKRSSAVLGTKSLCFSDASDASLLKDSKRLLSFAFCSVLRFYSMY